MGRTRALPLAATATATATATALILVGALMMVPLSEAAWDDPEAAMPAFLTLAMIPLTFSIANGPALQFVLRFVWPTMA